MTKPVIAVDIDDVLAIENEAVRQYANEQYGHSHAPEDYLVPGDYWGYWEMVQGTDEAEGKRRYGEYLASGVKASLEVMEGSLETLTWLKQTYDLIIVTSREAHLSEITEVWLKEHFPNVFSDIAFVALWTGEVKGSKAYVCTQLHASFLIDDNPGHLELAQACGIQGVLFGEYGWSKGRELSPELVRVNNWREVWEYFDGLS